MKFKKGDIVTWNFGTSAHQGRTDYKYVQHAYKIKGGQEPDLTFVTYFGQDIEIVVVDGFKYPMVDFRLITSILREEEE